MNFNGISADEAMNLLMDPEYYPTCLHRKLKLRRASSGKQADIFAGVVHGVEREREAPERSSRKNAIGWSLDRISKVAVAVMEAAMYECEHADDVLTAAAISEAVELTRKYERRGRCPLSTVSSGILPEGLAQCDGLGLIPATTPPLWPYF